jgi:hypothetical protein
MIERMMPAGADQRARGYLSLFVRGEVDSAAAGLIPELQTADARQQLEAIAEVLRGRSVDSLEVIGLNVHSTPDARHVNISYQLGDARGWAIANVAVRERGADWRVEGVTAQTTPASLEEMNRFRLGGQSVGRYLLLLAMVLAVVTSLVTAVVVARTRGMPKRWGWAALALVGVGQFSLNWTTGEWAFHPLQFALFSAGFLKVGPVAPWILAVALPAGAAVALWRRQRWRDGVDASAPVAADVPSTELGRS